MRFRVKKQLKELLKKIPSIAESIGKTPRGVKTMLTRRGLTAADYDGAAKSAKASASV